MMTRWGWPAALGLGLALGACDGPTRPASQPTGSETSQSSSLIDLSVAGPTALAPGETVQFRVTGRHADGSTRDLTQTPGLSWRTNNPGVLTISSSGMVTALAVGGAAITVSFEGKTGVKSIVVLEPGTYRLIGTATDNGVPLSGVRVTVTNGPSAGLVTTANPHYTFWGVSGDTEILATKEGYRDARKRIMITRDPERLDVELIPLIFEGNVEGIYTLTVTAAPECIAALPEPARVKTFTARLSQTGSRVTATLEGSEFLSWNSRVYNSFGGTLAGNHLAFYIGEGHFYEWPDVSQYLTPPSFYFLGGSVTPRVSARGLEGMLTGTLGVGEYDVFRFTVLASCRSTSHRFELVRQ
jgi:hypothetical protein